MFWKVSNDNNKLNALLENENTTLKDILDDESVVTEVQSYNESLLDFLLRDHNLIEMLTILTTTPKADGNGIIYFNIQNVIGNILSSFVTNIYEKLTSDDNQYLKLLFSPFIYPNETDNVVNSVTCSLIFKIAKVLCQQNNEKMFQFIMSCDDNLLENLIDNIENSSVIEFLIKCLQSYPTNETYSQFLEWLSEKKLIDQILSKLSHEEAHESITLTSIQCLIDLLLAIRQIRDPNPLRNQIESHKTVDKVISVLLKSSSNRSALIGACVDYIKVIFEAPEKPINPAYGSLLVFTRSKYSMKPEDMNSRIETFQPIVDCLIDRFQYFKDILQDYSSSISVSTVYGGVLNPPLGPHRLAIIELIQQLCALHHPGIVNAFVKHDLLKQLLELYNRYYLNSFLHRSLIDTLSQLIEYCFNSTIETTTQTEELAQYIFIQHNLLNVIIDSKTNIHSIVNDQGKQVKNVHWSFMRTLGNFINENKIQLEAVVSKDTFIQWMDFTNDKLAVDNKINELSRCTFNNLFDSSSEGDGVVEIEESEDINKLYEECTNQKLTRTFPSYTYEFTALPSCSKKDDLTISPLTDLFISTPEDRENAEKFESICNIILSPKHQRYPHHSKSLDKSNPGESLSLEVESPIYSDQLLLTSHDNGPNHENSTTTPDQEDPTANCNVVPSEYDRALSSKLIDDLFKEAYKEKLQQDRSHHISLVNKSGSAATNTTNWMHLGQNKQIKIPRLNFLKSNSPPGLKKIDREGAKSIICPSGGCSSPGAAGDSLRLNTDEILSCGLDSFDENEEDIGDQLQLKLSPLTLEDEEELEEDEDSDELESPRISAGMKQRVDIRPYYQRQSDGKKYDVNIDQDDAEDEEDDDDDTSLSSRLSRNYKLDTNSPVLCLNPFAKFNSDDENDQEQDSPYQSGHLSHKTSTNKVATVSTAIAESSNEIISSTVENVTPRAMVVSSSPATSSDDDGSDCDTPYQPHNSIFTDSRNKANPAVTMQTELHSTEITNPFSPKLTRIDLVNNVNSANKTSTESFQALNRSTSAPINLVDKSNNNKSLSNDDNRDSTIQSNGPSNQNHDQ